MPDPLFSVSLRRLYDAAGNPAVSTVVTQIKSRLTKVGSTQAVPSGLSARIAEWKNATTPREYTEIHQHLIQVLLDAARQHGAALQGLPTRESQWRVLWQRTRDEGISVETAADVCPYPGLSAYTPEDAQHFHGRAGVVDQLAAKANLAVSDGGIIVIGGASGAGKTSAVNAGLIPKLKRPWLRIAPGQDPVKALLRALHANESNAVEAAQLWARKYDSDLPVIIVDPAEDLFTVCTSADLRDQFMSLIRSLVEATRERAPAAIVVFSIRADYIGELLDYQLAQEAFDRNRAVMIGPLRPEDLHAAITAPARDVGLTLEPGLEDLALRDLCGATATTYDAGALPMLAYALTETWRHRENRRLTVAGYKATGGVTGALSATAERTWLDLSESEQMAAKAVLLRLVNIGDGRGHPDSRRVRTRDDLVDTTPATASALETLASARLISLDAHTVTLTHEIVLSAWPRLRRWIDDDRSNLLARQRLERDAAEWNGETTALYAGERLQEALASRNERNTLSPHASHFLEKSRRQERRRHQRRRMRQAVAVLAIVAVAVAAAAFAIQAHRADQARFTAEQGQIVGAADRYQINDPSLSANLLLAAHRRAPGDAAINSRLLATQNAPLATEMHAADGPIYTVALSPDGHTIAAASQDNAVHLWNITDIRHPHPIATLRGHSSFVTSAAYSPDGRILATTSDDATVRLWSLRNPTQPELIIVLTGHTGTVFNAAFSPDGQTLATVSSDRTVRLWTIGDGTTAHQSGVLTGSTGPVRTLAWSPDSQSLATGGNDNAIRLWNVANRKEIGSPLTRQTNHIHALAWSPDGATVLSGSDDNTAQLWDVTTLATPQPIGLPFGGHTGEIWSVAFAPDGGKLLTTSVDGTSKVWSIQTPSRPVQVGQTLSGDAGQLYSGVWTPDGAHVVTGAVDGMVRIWQLPTTVLPGHDGITIPAISADSRTMVSGSYDGQLRLWNTSDLSNPKLLDHTTEPSTTIFTTVSADGTLAATALQDGHINLRDIDNGRFSAPIKIPTNIGFGTALTLAPNGTWMAAITSSDSVSVWDIKDRHNPRLAAQFTPDSSRWIVRIVASPNSSKIGIAQADGTISVWNMLDIQKPTRIAGAAITNGAVNAIAFSGNDTFATAEDNIKLWKIRGSELVKENQLAGHDAPIRSVWFTSDGKTMVSGGDNQEIYLWDVGNIRDAHKEGANVTLPGPSHRFAGITGTGTALILAGDNGFLQVEPTDVDAAAKRVCRDSYNYLTAEKWNAAAPSINYSDPCKGN